jgi:uncharacterized protein YndB with AHSA1/START domain
MTKDHKLKKAIRARAKKTGESYAAARRQYLKPPAPPKPPTKRKPAGSVGEAASRKATGHGPDHWFAVLDAFSPAGVKGHTAAAEHLSKDHGVPMWYCQGLTVAWERARGHRAMNQSCDGDFQVSVSRVVAAPIETVARAITDPKARRLWLKDGEPALERALHAGLVQPKSKGLRLVTPERGSLRYRWDGSVVQLYLYAKPGGKTSVVASNEELPEAHLVETRREAWKDALDALKTYLSGD